MTWFEDKTFGVNRNIPIPRESDYERKAVLVVSGDGIEYETITAINVPGADETTLRFMPDGEMIAMIRTVVDGSRGWIGHSRPPYKDWEYKRTDHRFGGPDFIVLSDGSMWAGSRGLYPDVRKGPGEGKTVLASMTRDSYEPVLTLPSGGDCSYPGFEWHENVLWMSYYPSHEGNTNQYLARIHV